MSENVKDYANPPEPHPFSSRYFQAHKTVRATKPLEECPICRRQQALVQDHCHTTGLNRGRICCRCNTLVGRLEWQPEQLERLRAYIDGWRFEHQHGGVPYRPAKP